MKYRFPDRVLVQKVAAETVLLDMDKGEYFELNQMGAGMLEQLRSTGTFELALAALQARYDVDGERLERDFGTLIAELEAQGLLMREKE